LAIAFDLQEEGTLIAPHIIKHVGDKVSSDGDESDEVAFSSTLRA
jgi:hypothetical protein